jgi:heat shock protein HspQ
MTQPVNTPDFRTAAPADSALSGLDVQALIAGIVADTAPLFAAMNWAEEEIAAARRRHPEQADAIYHAFHVLLPRDIGPGMGTAFVYRGHVRELLERRAAGADLRPATAAEICLALVQTSLRAPMHGPAAGLYFRMWLAAFPNHALTAEHAHHQVHYEHLQGPRIDELEAQLRHQLRDPDRQLGDIDCAGRHHGRPVACTYACR